MYICLTVDEALLYTGWMRGPGDELHLGLCEIMRWDPRAADDDPETFDQRMIMLSENTARELGIIAPATKFSIRRERDRIAKGYSIIRATHHKSK